MKYYHRVLSILLILTTFLSTLHLGILQLYAHEVIPEVGYDSCAPLASGDGVGETWYALDNCSESRHISHEEMTIKYYFEKFSEDQSSTWTTRVSEAVAENIKSAYAESMKKWNNVYFYCYDSSGRIVKKKIINVTEGTEADHNLHIYPIDVSPNTAETSPIGNEELLESEGIVHKHYSEWKMVIKVTDFCEDTYISFDPNVSISDIVENNNSRTGAHELGHVLGLRDVDIYCDFDPSYTPTSDGGHHHELLMGYGQPLADRAQNITYKDIAGVAIIRGFHTDADHKWLNCGMQSDGQYKLVCTICNGVKKVDSLNGYTYDTYGVCNGNHELADGNMMAVASYGNKDYYKCKYCRYVAPFSELVTQSYTKQQYDDMYHKYVNTVNGLSYSFLEKHKIVAGQCRGCGQVHSHSYDYETVYHDHDSHLNKCFCGASQEVPHSVRASEIVDGRYAPCLGCGVMLDLTVDSAEVGYFSLPKVSVNGSYILDNGIVVLVDADITAYLNGTLQFYEPDDLPVVA